MKKIVKLALNFLLIGLLVVSVIGNTDINELSRTDRIKLAQSYYRVAMYYYNNDDKKKGDEFLDMAKSIDPQNFESNSIGKDFNNTDYIDLVKNLSNEDNLDKICSYPIYKYDKTITLNDKDSFLNLHLSEIKDNKFTNIELVEKNYAETFKLTFAETDKVYKAETESQIFYFQIRNFGNYIKLIGYQIVNQ